MTTPHPSGGQPHGRRVFLHVGSPKTGTTFLQNVLWAQRDLAREQGLMLPLERFGDHYLASLDVRGLSGREEHPERAVGIWDRLVAEVDGQPAGTAALSVTQGVAAFYGTSTLPEFRGRGVQAALLAARLHLAAEAGADLASVFVTPGSGSERNVRRAGFRVAGVRLTFTRAG